MRERRIATKRRAPALIRLLLGLLIPLALALIAWSFQWSSLDLHQLGSPAGGLGAWRQGAGGPLPPLLAASSLRHTLALPRDAHLPAGIDAVYVVHSPSLVERKAYLDAWFAAANITRVHYVTDFSAASLPPELVRAHRNDSAEEWARRAVATASIEGGAVPPYTPLNNVEIAVFLSHVAIWQAVAASPAVQRALVLEDDVIFEGAAEAVLPALSHYLSQLGSPYEEGPVVLFPGRGMSELSGAGCEPHSANLIRHRLARAAYADTYVIDKRAAAVLSEVLLPFVGSVDWDMTWGMQARGVAVFWTRPVLSRQGSGQEYASALRHKNGTLVEPV